MKRRGWRVRKQNSRSRRASSSLLCCRLDHHRTRNHSQDWEKRHAQINYSDCVRPGTFSCSGTPRSWAQDSSAARPPAAQATGYRLDFSINEMEDGKKINARHYSMNLTDDDASKELKIGTRVPVEPEPGKFQYVDVGTYISAKMYLNHNSFSLDVKVEISSLASPDQATRGQRPLVRQMMISGGTLVVSDKPIIIGSVDDPNSKRRINSTSLQPNFDRAACYFLGSLRNGCSKLR